MIKLFLDTRDNKVTIASLDIDGNKFEEIKKSENNRPHSILLLVEKLCNRTNVNAKDIDEIHVEEGPGSYTGLKVGVSIANALSFSLNKKVNGKNYGEITEPIYE